jgi:hypothetical protein
VPFLPVFSEKKTPGSLTTGAGKHPRASAACFLPQPALRLGDNQRPSQSSGFEAAKKKGKAWYVLGLVKLLGPSKSMKETEGSSRKEGGENEQTTSFVGSGCWRLPGNLVAQALAGDDGNLLGNALVGVKVQRQAGVVLLDDEAGSLLHGLGAHATPANIVSILSNRTITHTHTQKANQTVGRPVGNKHSRKGGGTLLPGAHMVGLKEGKRPVHVRRCNPGLADSRKQASNLKAPDIGKWRMIVNGRGFCSLMRATPCHLLRQHLQPRISASRRMCRAVRSTSTRLVGGDDQSRLCASSKKEKKNLNLDPGQIMSTYGLPPLRVAQIVPSAGKRPPA